MEEDSTIEITISEGCPLIISKNILTQNSSVFTHLLVDLGLQELEIEDFNPDIVILFLTLLSEASEGETVEHAIEEGQFRELHKICVVFNVECLISHCRDWLNNKINELADAESGAEITDQYLFVYKECLYMHNKWKLSALMQTLITKTRFKNDDSFIRFYLRENYQDLKTEELQFLLHMVGSDPKVFLEMFIERLNGQESLDEKTKYLLQHINLQLCLETNEGLYHQLFERLSEMCEMSNDDHKFVLKLITKESRKAAKQRNNISTKTEVWYDDEWHNFKYHECVTLVDIVRLIKSGKIWSMYQVIMLVSKVTRGCLYSSGEPKRFIETLENFFDQDIMPLKKVSINYIDMILSSLELRKEPVDDEYNNEYTFKSTFIKILETIKNSGKLSSSYENVQVIGKENPKPDPTLRNLFGKWIDYSTKLYEFKMDHPGVRDCNISGDCGFLLKYNIQVFKDPPDSILSTMIEHYDLTREADDYKDSSVHIHDIIKAERIGQYYLWSGTTTDGHKVEAPFWFLTELWFDGDLNEWIQESFDECVDYNMGDSLVAKY